MALQKFYAHGKLMLSGEYAVLDGAASLAIPTKFGQRMEVQSEMSVATEQLIWQGFNSQKNLWLDAQFPGGNLEKEEVQRLHQILKHLESLNPELFKNKHLKIRTDLEFPNNWGLGSSSTLISLLAQWAEIDPFKLLEQSFGGSGYDIACAQSDSPILYTKGESKSTWETVELNPNWTDHAYFVFLEQKKNSREAIKHYRSLKDTKGVVSDVTALSKALLEAKTVKDAQNIIEEHERIMSKVLNLASINDEQFSDFAGVCKSLGAWGGDFILALSVSNQNYIKEYFAKKGLKTVFAYNDMIWKK